MHLLNGRSDLPMSNAAKDSVSNKWFPAMIAYLLDAKSSYLTKMPEGVEIEKTLQRLKPYKERRVCSIPKAQKATNPDQDRPKCDTKLPAKI